MMTTYAAVGIVKDEAERIDACLASLRPYISAATFVDTGSTDDTVERIRRGLPDIPVNIVSEPFVNFGVTRSRAFALARGTAVWLLASDADMLWTIDPGFEPHPDVASYMIEMGGADFSYRLPLVLRGDLAWKSVGAVHEYTCLTDGTLGRREPTDAISIAMPQGDRSSPQKTAWQAGLLEAALRKDPDDARSVFYLAQSYRELGDTASARTLYQRRARMLGFEEEAWYAAYRAALLTEWPAGSVALTEAWERRPLRLEPLYGLVQALNQRGLHQAAYRLCEGATVGMALPDDTLFVHRSVWDWGMAFERSVAAWWTGYPATFDRLTAALLKAAIPEHIRVAVERNAGYERAA